MSLAMLRSARPDRHTDHDDPAPGAYWCRTCARAVSPTQVFPNWQGMMPSGTPVAAPFHPRPAADRTACASSPKRCAESIGSLRSGQCSVTAQRRPRCAPARRRRRRPATPAPCPTPSPWHRPRPRNVSSSTPGPTLCTISAECQTGLTCVQPHRTAPACAESPGPSGPLPAPPDPAGATHPGGSLATSLTRRTYDRGRRRVRGGRPLASRDPAPVGERHTGSANLTGSPGRAAATALFGMTRTMWARTGPMVLP